MAVSWPKRRRIVVLKTAVLFDWNVRRNCTPRHSTGTGSPPAHANYWACMCPSQFQAAPMKQLHWGSRQRDNPTSWPTHELNIERESATMLAVNIPCGAKSKAASRTLRLILRREQQVNLSSTLMSNVSLSSSCSLPFLKSSEAERQWGRTYLT